MGIFRRNREQRTLSVVGPLYPIGTLRPLEALKNPTVYAAVRVLADAAASCPLIVYRRVGDDRQRAGGRTAELLQRPADGMTQANLVQTLITHLIGWGNAFLGKYRDGDGRLVSLLPVPPDNVQVERRNGRIVFRVSDAPAAGRFDPAYPNAVPKGSGRVVEHGLDDIVHIRALSVDGLVGLSPLHPAAKAIELDNAVRAAREAETVGNEARLSLADEFARAACILSAWESSPRSATCSPGSRRTR